MLSAMILKDWQLFTRLFGDSSIWSYKVMYVLTARFETG
jgi:hypothetical protein